MRKLRKNSRKGTRLIVIDRIRNCGRQSNKVSKRIKKHKITVSRYRGKERDYPRTPEQMRAAMIREQDKLGRTLAELERLHAQWDSELDEVRITV
jgi:hypothetical protein